MKNCTCSCAKENDEQKYKKLAELMKQYKNSEGSLIQVLHIAQAIFGCLPLELQRYIAQGMGKPLSEVSGVVTFYSFFATRPRGKHVIRVCLGTACYVRGGKKIITRLEEILGVGVGETTKDGLFTFEVARCIGACGLAPVIMIDDMVYKQVKPEKLENILAQYN